MHDREVHLLSVSQLDAPTALTVLQLRLVVYGVTGLIGSGDALQVDGRLLFIREDREDKDLKGSGASGAAQFPLLGFSRMCFPPLGSLPLQASPPSHAVTHSVDTRSRQGRRAPLAAAAGTRPATARMPPRPRARRSATAAEEEAKWRACNPIYVLVYLRRLADSPASSDRPAI